MKKDSPALERLINSFKSAEERVNKVLFQTKAGSVQELQVKIDRELNNINLDLINRSKKWAEKDIDVAYQEGIRKVDNKTHNSINLSKTGVSNDTILNSYIELNDSISKATQQTIQNVNNIISNSLKDGITSVYDVKKKFQEEMLKQNNNLLHVEYKNGAKVSISAYSSMVARTARIEASNTGSLDRCKAMNIDLVKCTKVPNCCPYCMKYEGKVYSISGKDTRFPKLYGDNAPFQNGYNIMHPNCRHEFLPYIEDLQTEEGLKKDIKESNHFTNYSVHDKIFNVYQRNQAKLRQYRKEYQTYKTLKQEYGSDFPYKTLGGFRRAYRHYSNKYPDAPSKIKDFEVRVEIKSDKYPKKINEQKQNKHYKGTQEYLNNKQKDKSYLVIPMEECQLFIDTLAGSGKIQYTNDGKFKNQEIIECHKIVGYVKDLNGEWLPTTKLKIHYSKTGTHVVPTLRG